MPAPTPAQLEAAFISSLGAVGAVGFLGPSPWSGVPFNAMHRLASVAAQVLAPLLASHLVTGVFIGSLGGPSAAAAAPAPLPIISPAHVTLATALPRSGAVASASAQAASVGWIGGVAQIIPLGVRLALLDALTASGWGITVAPGELAFASLLSGFLTWTRAPFNVGAAASALLAAWGADPELGLGERTALATVYASSVGSVAELDLCCAIANPAGSTPVVPGTPYPASLPVVSL